MISYQFNNSDFIRGSVGWDVNISSRICFVSVMGILQYIFVMSRYANVEVGVIGARFNSWIRSVVLFMLNEYGNGVNCLIFVARSFGNLYSGA